MNFKRIISLIFCVLLVIGFTNLHAHSDITLYLVANSNYPELVLTEMKDTPKASILTSFDKESIIKIKKDKNFAQFYGEDAETVPLQQMEAWINDLREVTANTILGEKFLYPQGPVIAFGVSYLGVVKVTLNEDHAPVDPKIIDQIHKRIAKEAAKRTKTSKKVVPVFFEYGGVPETVSAQARYRPLISGVQADNRSQYITIGFPAVKEGVVGYEDVGYTTPTHANNQGYHTRYFQPVYEWWRPNYNYLAEVWSSRIGYMLCDTTWSLYANVTPHIYVTANFQRLIVNYLDPKVGDMVWKSGAKTGVTGGHITAFLDYVAHPSFSWPLMNQYEMSMVVEPGDSGSPVYIALPSGEACILGMVWGRHSVTGRSYMSPVSGVWKEIKVYPLSSPPKRPSNEAFLP